MALLEICCYSYESAQLAASAGAERVELCAGAGLGGTTPDEDTIRRVRSIPDLSLYVMIRPRGGDFCYSETEFEQMKADIQNAKALGVDGVVFGILNRDKTIDGIRNARLAKEAYPLDITFHKAFDETDDVLKALDEVYKSGIRRVLSSGAKASAEEGIETLKAMVKHEEGRMNILVGGGVRSDNLLTLTGTGAREYHSSAILPEEKEYRADEKEIRKMRHILDKHIKR
jgi:copper homeostasis protein